MTKIIVVIGPGSIGQAMARRVGAGKHVLLADLRQENADAAAKTLSEAGFEVTTTTVDVSSRASVETLVAKARSLGDVHGVIHAAGVSPSQAAPETILKVDLYGTALVLEEFGKVIAEGGAGIVIASQSGHRLPPLSAEQDHALATTPVEELLNLAPTYRRRPHSAKQLLAPPFPCRPPEAGYPPSAELRPFISPLHLRTQHKENNSSNGHQKRRLTALQQSTRRVVYRLRAC